MNILVFSRSAWDTTKSFGNTASNFFGNWQSDCFAHFYIRKQIPNDSIVDLYYNLSTKDIIKELFGFKNVNKQMKRMELDQKLENIEKEKNQERKFIDNIHKRKKSIIYLIDELIWLSGIWINKDFKKFIEEVNPDIFFAFAANTYILYPLICYLKKYTKAKIVLFIADDVYNDYGKKSIFRKGYLKKTYKLCMQKADLVYAISRNLMNEYGLIFDKEIKLLRKGCEFSKPVSNIINKPLKMVYAGNLLYGRCEILGKIASVIEKINKEEVRIKLEIYTADTVTEGIEALLNKDNSSKIMGARSYEQIKSILNESDIVLHVESFEAKQIEYVRYSFSTKIIDCLQSGSGVLAVGPANISSIEYLRSIQGVKVVDDLNNIEKVVCELVENASQIPINAADIRKFAVENHDINKVKNNLRKEFEEIISS